MTQGTKTFSVSFYRGHIGPDDRDGQSFATLVSSLELNDELLSPQETFGIVILDVRDGLLFGELKSYREDAPHIGKPHGDEREVEMGDDEYVIEKTFFVLSIEYCVMAFMGTANFRSPRQVAAILEHNLNDTVCHFSQVLQHNATRRLMSGGQEIKSVDCMIALPSARLQEPSDHWSQSALALADGASGRLRFTVSANMRGSDRHPIEQSLLGKIVTGVQTGILSKAKATTADGEPIDLINDRLTDRVSPIMNGKYPSTRSVYEELSQLFRQHSETLENYRP